MKKILIATIASLAIATSGITKADQATVAPLLEGGQSVLPSVLAEPQLQKNPVAPESPSTSHSVDRAMPSPSGEESRPPSKNIDAAVSPATKETLPSSSPPKKKVRSGVRAMHNYNSSDGDETTNYSNHSDSRYRY